MTYHKLRFSWLWLVLLVAVLVLATRANGQPPQAPIPPQGPPIIDDTILPTSTKWSKTWPTYNEAGRDALKGHHLLVVFVGTPARDVRKAWVCYEDTFERVAGRAVVLGLPDGKGGFIRHEVPVGTSDDGIWAAVDAKIAAINRRAVPFQASPFQPRFLQEPLVEAQPVADDNIDAAGPWHVSVEKPAGLVRFKRAMFTQRIAVTDNRDTIQRVPRSGLEAKWQVSGGMAGLTGWRSDVYRFVPETPKVWVGDISVLNSLGYFQNNRGWKRSYADGTQFHDVLSNKETGEVFEHRVREKKDGVWKSFVVFSSKDARPAGYHGLQQSCSSCHDQAGSGGYATGLVPGGDNTISDIFQEIQ